MKYLLTCLGAVLVTTLFWLFMAYHWWLAPGSFHYLKLENDIGLVDPVSGESVGYLRKGVLMRWIQIEDGSFGTDQSIAKMYLEFTTLPGSVLDWADDKPFRHYEYKAVLMEEPDASLPTIHPSSESGRSSLP